ncbi:MAG: hypothetical protein K2R98_04500 [Gemmataceae bacterium]|nr:hypothetical protein [Gemmataceae bacterium]
MSTIQSPVSDMLVTVKAREVQRAMLAEMRGDRVGQVRHFLAGAHLELVLADDYEQIGQSDLALRSRLSAASCFWRGAQIEQARRLLDELLQSNPSCVAMIQEVVTDLAANYPAPAPEGA